MHIPRITDFPTQASDPAAYVELPEGWSMAVADVVGSTVLASQGRDRAVNFVAGSVVAVLSDVIGTADAPAVCQFGGDGAVAAVPPGAEEGVRRALGALAYWAEASLGVSLRVGLVPVADLRAEGYATLAALHDFGGGNVLGLFLGHGAIIAEDWVKADPRWSIPPAEGPLPGLEGLSCRWEPVTARRGVVLCVIVDPVAPGPAGLAALAEVHARLGAVVTADLSAPFGQGEALVPPAAPRWSLAGLEAATRRGLGARVVSRLWGLIGSALIYASYKLGRPLGVVDARRYLRAVARQSDHSKQNGGLRLVLDLTPAEADAIDAVLAEAEAGGAIVSGTARSDAATMTCLVGDFSSDRHVHFVDGSGLGFWRASTALKAKRAISTANPVQAAPVPVVSPL